MQKIRVLIVDDAVLVRSRVSRVLSSDPELEVVGVAADGYIALAKIPQVNPDVIILDIEMPQMNGLETLAAIRKTYPLLAVIMFSTLTARGAKTTLSALSLGATDYATKPTNTDSIDEAIQHIRNELIPKIKVHSKKVAIAQLPIPLTTKVLSLTQVDIVAIGVSTGGPNALATVLPEFPADFPVPILIVQHMPPMFTKLLAERLASKSKIRVKEAESKAVLEPGCAWIAPGDFHMIVEKDGKVVRLGTHQQPPENSCRPSVDVLFRSVAEVYGKEAIAVVLTGMGQDGLRGCEQISSVGGQILAQDEASSVVWGMPGFVANAGLANKVLPLDQIAFEIMRRVTS